MLSYDMISESLSTLGIKQSALRQGRTTPTGVKIAPGQVVYLAGFDDCGVIRIGKARVVSTLPHIAGFDQTMNLMCLGSADDYEATFGRALLPSGFYAGSTSLFAATEAKAVLNLECLVRHHLNEALGQMRLCGDQMLAIMRAWVLMKCAPRVPERTTNETGI